MRESLLELLVDPVSRTPLTLEPAVTTAGEVLEGALRSHNGTRYPITNGIPRLLTLDDEQQRQIETSFGFKWQQRQSYESESFLRNYHQWLREKYGFASDDELRTFFGGKKRTLEVGCGGGLSGSISLSCGDRGQQWVGIDISPAIDIARERLGRFPGAEFVQADIVQLPFREESFDAVFAEGVLHHTPATDSALRSVVRMLAPGGEVLFYVYRKKGAIREFTDDYIRNLISEKPPQEAWEVLLPLTRLGQSLAELNAEVEVEEDIPYLGIKAGRYDVQRLVYWNFAKLFWNQDYPFETNHHINFDWYHPRYAHRQTEAQIRSWCSACGVRITYLNEQESGFTVRAIKE